MQFGVVALTQLLIKKARLLITMCVLTTAAALAVCVVVPASYKSSAMVLVKPGRYVESSAEAAAVGSARQEQNINSLVEVLVSPEVVQRAITAFGVQRLYPNLAPDSPAATGGRVSLSDLVWSIRAKLFSVAPDDLELKEKGQREERAQAALSAATKSLSAGSQPKTDLIWVTFTHKDPRIAADFANALLKAFRLRTIELYGRTGAAAFFSEQKTKYDQAFEATSTRLSDFAISNNVYAIDEQRKLTLERRNELLTDLVKSRSQIVEKKNQATATATQLTNLKPVAQYPQVRELAKSTPKPDVDSTDAEAALVRAMPDIPNASSSPPLLLVRVYQDTVQSLVKLKTDVAGLAALETHQLQELAKVDAELEKLAQSESKFERLKLEVTQAKEASQQYAGLATKEQLGAEVSEKGLSTIDVAQGAIVPLRPSFPNPSVIIPFGGAIGLALGLAIALLQIVGFTPSPANTRSGTREGEFDSPPPLGPRPVTKPPSLAVALAEQAKTTRA